MIVERKNLVLIKSNMPLKQFTIDFRELAQDAFLRNDEKYHIFLNSSDWNLFESKSKDLVSLKDILVDDYNLFNYEDGEEYKGIPTGATYLDEDGEIKEFQPVTAENHPGRLKYKASNDNILVSSLRLAKSPALYFENQNLSNYVFSNGFYIYKIKDGWNKKFILYILRTKRLKNILDNHIYRGIGISAYKDDDLKKIKIPFIPKLKQGQIAAQIEPIEKKIKELKSQIAPAQEVVNKVFARILRFNIQEAYSAEQQKYFSVSNTLTYRNTNLRSSVRWHKITPIQKVLYKNTKCINKLGKYIIETKNGWSPNCREIDSLNFVFGVNSLSTSTVMNYDDLKTSNEERIDIKNYFVKEGDLFVSRGNTVDLVALASVVENMPTDKDVIFPDLFIRIEVNEKKLNKKYLAYLFNSIIGRLYFKYSAKGKNQTMVKISSDELNNFYLPVPSLKDQQKIVDEIKAELDKQEEMKQKIESERVKIDEIIGKAIT